MVCFPLTPALSPAFAEAASRRQAPGERGIRGLSPRQFKDIQRRIFRLLSINPSLFLTAFISYRCFHLKIVF
jgi:hypothetical protein